MSDINIDKIIGEVAKKHGIALSKDDPILVTVSLNEAILREYISDINIRLNEQQRIIAEGQIRALEESKDIAERLISKSAAFIADEIAAAGTALRNDLSNESCNNNGEARKTGIKRDYLSTWLMLTNIVISTALLVTFIIKM